jgi:SsrA-binding protein
LAAHKKKRKHSPGTLATNRSARRNYDVIDSIEAGLALKGTEVKSIRAGKFSIEQSHGRVENRQVFLHDFNILPYEYGNIHNHDPRRPKRLLLHKQEIVKLNAKLATKGLTLVPLRVYLKHRRVKVEIGLCKGRNLHDKRESLKQKTADRESKRVMEQY